MPENRRYYYLKLKENFYHSETMVILESMQDGLLYSNLLLKMYLMSLKSNGVLMLNDHLPHSDLYPASGGYGRARAEDLSGIWSCGDSDGWRILHDRHPAPDWPVIQRRRAQEEGAHAPAKAEAPSIRCGHLSAQ